MRTCVHETTRIPIVCGIVSGEAFKQFLTPQILCITLLMCFRWPEVQDDREHPELIYYQPPHEDEE